MKTMKTPPPWAAAALAVTALTLAIPHASAALVSVEIGGGGEGDIPQSTVVNPPYGIWSEGSNYWNTVGGLSTTSPLVDSSNTLTTITFSITGAAGHAGDWNGGTSDNLVKDGRYQTGVIITTAISGLLPNTAYNLLVYHADDYVSETVTVNGAAAVDFTGSVGSTGYLDAFDGLPGSDFWYFSSVNSGPSGVLNIASSGSGYNTIVGFQLQAIPEPSAALLGGLGMLALLRRRR